MQVTEDEQKDTLMSSVSAKEDESKTVTKESTEEGITSQKATGQCAAAQDTSKSTSTDPAHTQGATAPSGESGLVKEIQPTSGLARNWIARFVQTGHDCLWPSGMTPSAGPTLLTGVKIGEDNHLLDNLMEWERKLESADLTKHGQFLQGVPLIEREHPFEATAWENGHVPETEGLPPDQLEFRIQSLLPPLAYMVSRPKQPAGAGEELLRRFDAGIRPYWLRDWQAGFGGYTKVYEYQVNGVTKRKFSVAHVVRPRTKSSNACLCFTLMSNLPDQRPWRRPAGAPDPSRGIILDLNMDYDRLMPATVLLYSNAIASSLEDDMQIQCLPVFNSDHP